MPFLYFSHHHWESPLLKKMFPRRCGTKCVYAYASQCFSEFHRYFDEAHDSWCSLKMWVFILAIDTLASAQRPAPSFTLIAQPRYAFSSLLSGSYYFLHEGEFLWYFADFLREFQPLAIYIYLWYGRRLTLGWYYLFLLLMMAHCRLRWLIAWLPAMASAKSVLALS